MNPKQKQGTQEVPTATVLSSHRKLMTAQSMNFQSLNPKFTPDTTTPCPVCQQMSLETAYQPPLVPKAGQTGYTLCHCKNAECQMYGVTLNREQYQMMAALEQLAAQLQAALKAQKGNK